MAAKHFVQTYSAEISSLKSLEHACERDQMALAARIISLELGQNNGTKITVAKYESARGLHLSHLTFEEYTTDCDLNTWKAIHETKGESLLFTGAAYIANKAIKVLAFGTHGSGDEP